MSRIEQDIKLDYSDVLIKPKRSPLGSRSAVELEKNYRFYHSPLELDCVPIIAANMDTTGTFAMAKALAEKKMMVALHKFYSNDQYIESLTSGLDNTWFSMGIMERDIRRLEDLAHDGIRIEKICVDVANGYTDYFVEQVAVIRGIYNDAIIMAGNVCTPEMVQELIIHGKADIVKVGIGPGSVCTTRKVTGVGYPQLSAVLECADVAHGLKREAGRLGLICADGGCNEPGDIVKAFAAGADFVMLGGMFAGTDECDGKWEYDKVETYTDFGPDYIKKSLSFYGMSSYAAQDKYNGGVADYKAAEGKKVSVPYKGPVKDVLQQVEGGIRSACAYVGATSLKDIPRCTTFVRVNSTHNTVFGI
jgi:GMP reductase